MAKRRRINWNVNKYLSKKKKKDFTKGKTAGPVRYLYTSKNPSDDKFFKSQEWRTARFFTLKKYDRKCALCFRTNVPLHVDHIKPRSKFPELALNPNNLQVLCEECNLGKLNYDDTDFRPVVKGVGQ